MIIQVVDMKEKSMHHIWIHFLSMIRNFEGYLIPKRCMYLQVSYTGIMKEIAKREGNMTDLAKDLLHTE